MKCYRIREGNRTCFLMETQWTDVDKNYDEARRILKLHFANKDGQLKKFEFLINEENYALFELRWERFHASDEIFFDCVEFQEDK